MLLGKTEAIDRIKAETRLSERECIAIVEKLPKRKDGKRDKFWPEHVEAVIAKENRPPQSQPAKTKKDNVRPFSQKLITRIRQQGARA
jgi:hypothetical protein